MKRFAQLLRFRFPVVVVAFQLAAMHASDAQDSAVQNENKSVPAQVTWHVANNGIDSPDCGKRKGPCRSISQAIHNAAAGDTVSVGPGIYGDVNHDEDYNDPGDEHLAPNGECIVCVDKRLRLISTDGAQNTVIRRSRFDPVVFLANVVALTAPGIRFGDSGRGFTVRGGEGGRGVAVASLDVTDVRITGNIILDFFAFGLTAFGSGVCAENVVTGSNIGFTVGGNWRVIDNLAIANNILGIGAGGEFALLRGNISTNNGRGFTVNPERAIVERNIASGSAGEGELGVGFAIFRTNIRFVHNTAVGNRGFGVWFFAEGAELPIFKRNNFVGNDRVSNCGFVNQSGLDVDARQNYWGAATGPGPDPADNGGPNSGCDLSGSTIVTPFATSPVPTEKRRHDSGASSAATSVPSG